MWGIEDQQMWEFRQHEVVYTNLEDPAGPLTMMGRVVVLRGLYPKWTPAYHPYAYQFLNVSSIYRQRYNLISTSFQTISGSALFHSISYQLFFWCWRVARWLSDPSCKVRPATTKPLRKMMETMGHLSNKKLVGGFKHFLFSIIYGIIIPTD